MQTEHPLEARVRRHLLDLGLGTRPLPLLVALSGGGDSVVLLHLLRFRLPSLQLQVTAAHLDHAMRAGSAADAQWVRGLCAAWEVSLLTRRLDVAPRSEADARDARYAFLRECAREAGATLIATAHHADDQAETVLFRAVRGTGLRGLAGIAPLADGVLRPLLPLWRDELQRYAGERGLRWRTDPSNAGLDPVRNRLRHEILPLIERRVSPSARRSLVSLASLAAEAEEALERIAADAAKELVRWEGVTASLARDRLRLYDSAVTSRVLRNLLRHFGVVLGRTGTRRALQFITDAHSGRQMPLSGGLRVEIEFDRALIRQAEETAAERSCEIASSEGAGEATVCVGGAVYRIHYGPADRGTTLPPEDDGWTFRDDPASLAFPLRVRGWRDGDRLRTHGGRRSLKRIFLEERVPRDRRKRLPLLVDASGEVVWVAGLGPNRSLGTPQGGASFMLRVEHD